MSNIAAVLPGGETGAGAQDTTGQRRLRFNATDLDERGLKVIGQLETYTGSRLPDGDYWYDAISGASGPWGGGAFVLLPPGLPLGGALRADASGGGSGYVTGVFVNGRELHADDIANLRRFMQPLPGRYWVDATGNGGLEGGPPLFNLYVLMQAAERSHGRSSRKGRTWVGGGMATSSWNEDGGRVTTDCSYDPNDGGMITIKTRND